MSSQDKEQPYVFQPYGVNERKDGRLWGVSYKSAEIKGLLKDEANIVCGALNDFKDIGDTSRYMKRIYHIAKVSCCEAELYFKTVGVESTSFKRCSVCAPENKDVTA